MTPHEDKSILTRNPVTSLVVAALICCLVGLALIMTAVGSIIGIPLMVIGLVCAVAGAWQYKKRSPSETATIPEADHHRA